MRDAAAALLALFLLFVALSLIAALQTYRGRRAASRREMAGRGRAIIAELPTGPDLTLFTEDETSFYFGAERIDKEAIRAVRVLINGSPIAASVSRRVPETSIGPAPAFEDRPEGIARDRWDVAIESADGTLMVPCGAIRERVSQELARRIFDAVRRDIERRDESRGAYELNRYY